MLLYRIICLVLFTIVGLVAARFMTGYGQWSSGFAWGIGIGCIAGVWAGTIERREKRANADIGFPAPPPQWPAA